MRRRFRADWKVFEFEPRLLPSLSIDLVKDVNTASGSSDPLWMIEAGGQLYFQANDAASGANLFRSDGTSAGTALVSDLQPGEQALGLQNLVNVGGTPFFTASHATPASTQYGLWKTDGASTGTVLVRSFSGSGTLNNLTPAGSTLYFCSNKSATSEELWKSNGTSAGTVLVSRINPTTHSFPSYLTVVGGILYLSANGAQGQELWRSDGTSSGTFQVRDIRTGTASSNPKWLTNVNGTLYFFATDTAGLRLWKSDGTSAGTVPLRSFSSVTASPMTDVGGRVYFAANGGSGTEIWTSDGTSSGTVQVKDINPGSGSASPTQLTGMNGLLYFAANDGTSGVELWTSDGTSAGTFRVRDIQPGAVGSDPANLLNSAGKLYFSANDGTTGVELWASDGTSGGTLLFKDIFPGAASSDPGQFTRLGNMIAFAANDGVHGAELWRSDGTSAGTVLVADILATTLSHDFYLQPLDNNGHHTANLNGTLMFTANDGASGRELWKSDGTSGGTVLVKDVNPGPAASGVVNLMNVNGVLFFTANDGVHGMELWRSDGTSPGTRMLRDILPGSAGSIPNRFTVLNGVLYFLAESGAGSRSLWRSDGTSSGTTLVSNVQAGLAATNNVPFPVLGDFFYFHGSDPAHGLELWRSDGTNSGTSLVCDIYPGAFQSASGRIELELNGVLYFPAGDGVNGTELWRSDGTSSGTWMVHDIRPGNQSSNINTGLIRAGSKFYFSANDGATGQELWCSDGTSAGTVLLDVTSGTGSSFSGPAFGYGNAMYFFGPSSIFGNSAIWRSDGMNSGTAMIAEPGTGRPFECNFVTTNGSDTYFSLIDWAIVDDQLFVGGGYTGDTKGHELYFANGPFASLSPIADISPGIPSSVPNEFTEVNGDYYFFANDGFHGHELFRLRRAGMTVTSPTPSGVATTGQTVQIQLNFSEPVTLSDGNLILALNSGATLEIPTFSGSTISVDYVVGPTDTSPRLDILNITLTSGATLRDAAGFSVNRTPTVGLAASSFFIVNPLPPTTVSAVTVNVGGTQRSRLTSITLDFATPVDAALLIGPGAITLTRTAGVSPADAGTVVQTGAVGPNGRILVSPSSGMVSSVTLTFDNADSGGVSAGVEHGSLADGYWQLSIPYLSFTSTLNDPNLRRLFGDQNSDGHVDSNDYGFFGATFGLSVGNSSFDPAFDYNADGVIDSNDLGFFGSRFGLTL